MIRQQKSLVFVPLYFHDVQRILNNFVYSLVYTTDSKKCMLHILLYYKYVCRRGKIW
jgi:hypothetical protein